MISPKVLSIAAAIALLLPMMAPTESFAQIPMAVGRNAARRRAVSARAQRRRRRMPAAVIMAAIAAVVMAAPLIPGAIAGAVVGGAIASQSLWRTGLLWAGIRPARGLLR